MLKAPKLRNNVEQLKTQYVAKQRMCGREYCLNAKTSIEFCLIIQIRSDVPIPRGLLFLYHFTVHKYHHHHIFPFKAIWNDMHWNPIGRETLKMLWSLNSINRIGVNSVNKCLWNFNPGAANIQHHIQTDIKAISIVFNWKNSLAYRRPSLPGVSFEKQKKKTAKMFPFLQSKREK